MNPRTGGQLLVPATQAARKLGISRRTLTKHIGAGLIRSVKVGSRVSIPQSEIDRIVNGEAKPETATGISSSGKSAEHLCQIRHISDAGEHSEITDPKERLDAILAGSVDFLRRFETGDPDAVAAVAAVGSPEERANAKEAYTHAIEVWKEYRE